MTDQGTRYDRIAEGYARWWAPVIAPSSVLVLDRIAPQLDDAMPVRAGDGEASLPVRLLDVGTGTGTVAAAALRRWPGLAVVGVDASREMVAAAERTVARDLGAAGTARFSTHVAMADRLPLADGEVDLAVSSFVLQLVPNRSAALREIHRVLRQGGLFAHVTWLRGDPPFEPDAVVDDILDEFELGDEEPDGRSGDIASAGAAAGALRRTGFRDVHASEAELLHRFDATSYQSFIEEFHEEDLFRSLDPEFRARVSAALRDRLARLRPAAFELRLPIIVVDGRRR